MSRSAQTSRARRRAPAQAFARGASVDAAIERGIMFAGTPDQVLRQIRKLYARVGGFGHLLIMGQAGFLEHDETVAGIRHFARHVHPALKEEFPDTALTSDATIPGHVGVA
jgi:alkanesulfonate monooxygenase SsuD/methylene tetrahydromethanopterin reductase-like flavin-dependent oxidoreductase (luciferase family)